MRKLCSYRDICILSEHKYVKEYRFIIDYVVKKYLSHNTETRFEVYYLEEGDNISELDVLEGVTGGIRELRIKKYEKIDSYVILELEGEARRIVFDKFFENDLQKLLGIY